MNKNKHNTSCIGAGYPQFMEHINMFDKLKYLFDGLELCTWGLQFQLFWEKATFRSRVVYIYFKVCEE